MRPLEIVVLDVELQSPLAIREIRKHRPRKEFLPQALPETLHLPQRLRMLRPALAVGNSLSPQFLLERRRPSPRRVLPALVRQHLPRCPVARYAARQRLQHQLRLLVMRQRLPHDEARMVIHEAAQVQPLVATQQKRKYVRLPQLIGLGPLEAPRQMLPRRCLRPGLLHQTGLVQDAPYLRLRNAQAYEPS